MDIAFSNQDKVSGQAIPDSSQLMTNPAPGSMSKNQILVLDGIRAIACLSVIFFHLHLFARHYGIWPPFQRNGETNIFYIISIYLGEYFGDSGVIIFFMLSSFLLFLPYAKSLLFDSPWPSLRRFYLRRIFRIIPGYFVSLLLIALLIQPSFLFPNNWHYLWLFLTFRMDFALSSRINIPFWTLAVEFQFYLLLPIIACLLRPIVRRGTAGWRMAKLTFCLLSIVAWGLATRYWGQFIADTSKLDFLIPHAVSTTLKPFIYGDRGKYFEVFAVGMLICMLYTFVQNTPEISHWQTRMRHLSWSMFLIGLLLLSFLCPLRFFAESARPNYVEYHIIKTSLDGYAPKILPYWLEWQALAYTLAYACCFWALLYSSSRLKCFFESSLLKRIASISYSLYMWHYPLIALFIFAITNNFILKQGRDSLVQYSTFLCWTLVVVFPVATMLYRWIEQPGIRMGEWLIDKLTK